MAISVKGKRRLTVREAFYLWQVFDNTDQTAFDGLQVMVTAVNRSLVVHYGMQQPDETRLAVVSRGIGSTPIRVRCSKFETDLGTMTPDSVRALIEWSLDLPGRRVASARKDR